MRGVPLFANAGGDAQALSRVLGAGVLKHGGGSCRRARSAGIFLVGANRIGYTSKVTETAE